MKKITLILLAIIISACSGSKRIQSSIAKGNYDKAIQLSVKKLRKNKTKKSKQKYVVLLEESFTKAVDEDNRNLERYKMDTNPAVIENVYETYLALDKRQELIRPLLPLHIISKNRKAEFKFVNYTNEINTAKVSLSDYLYINAQNLLQENNKTSARKAYRDLEYLQNITPNFKNTKNLLSEAHLKGTSFISVALLNETNQVIPKSLESDLLDFNSYGLNRFWTTFHSKPKNNIDYDYELKLLFNHIDVGPERIHEKQILKEKEIVDGFEYVLDQNGNVATDSLGNSIKVDKYITVKCDVFEIHQEKSSHIDAEVIVIDLKKNQLMDNISLESQFIFNHYFAKIRGDKRALDQHYSDMISEREIPFPTDEQMIYDTGEDLKNKLAAIIEDYNFPY